MPLFVPSDSASASSAAGESTLQWTPLQPVIAPRKAGVTPGWLRRTLALPAIRRSAEELIQRTELPVRGAHESAATTEPSSSSPSATPSSAAAACPSSASSELGPLVYAGQRELAMVSPALSPHIEWLGSADATTCVILILQCESTRRSIVVHLDGADSRQLTGEVASAGQAKSKAKSKSKTKSTAAGRISCLRDALNLLSAEDCSAGISVHMVGGFQTHRTTAEEREAEEAEDRLEAAAAASQSASTSSALAAAAAAADDDDDGPNQSDGLLLVSDILAFLHLYSTASASLAGARAVDLRLRTLCVGPLNTQWKAEEQRGAESDADAAALHYPRPYLTSLFLHLPSCTLHGRLPLRREDRGPDMILRMIRTSVGEGSQLTSVYAEAADEFVLSSFQYGRIHAPSLLSLLALPDAEFLAQSSTSPLVEPPNFLPDMRAVYAQLAAHPDWRQCFPQPERFARWTREQRGGNRWTKV